MGTVFTQAFNLSDNVKYLNYKIDTTPSGGGLATGTTSLEDRQELMHRIQEFITTDRDNQQIPTNKTLGWQRIDGADSSGAIWNDSNGVDTGGNAVYGFLRSKCYDYSTSGHWKYLRLKLFERDERNLYGQASTEKGARYATSDNVLVLRYDVYADFSVTAEDSAAVITAINGGINSAEADGFPSTDLDAGRLRALQYSANVTRRGFNAAYNSISPIVNAHQGPAAGANRWKRCVFGNGGSINVPVDHRTNAGVGNDNSVGYYPNTVSAPRRGYGLGHNVFSTVIGVTGFGDSELSEQAMWNEIKLIIDGNGTLWGFGDQDRTGAGGIDSASGTNGFKGVNATGADARYLALFSTQHQDDDPENQSPYNSIIVTSEYKKEFGEPVNSGHIHNAMKWNPHYFIMNNGVASPPNIKHVTTANWTNNASDNTGGTMSTSHSGTTVYTSYAGSSNEMTNNNSMGAIGSANRSHTFYNDAWERLQSGTQANTQKQISTGHGFMGPDVANLNTADAPGTAANRSRSMGQIEGGDARNNPAGYHNSWKSRVVGNNAFSNSSTNAYGGTSYRGGLGRSARWVGVDGAQFALTEYPCRADESYFGTVDGGSYGANTGTNTAGYKEMIQNYGNYVAPASGREHLSATRLHMGYLGYVGHLNSYTAYSLNELFFGSQHGLFGDGESTIYGHLSEHYIGEPANEGQIGQYGPSIPFVSDFVDSVNGVQNDSLNQARQFVQEFHPIPNSQAQYSVYEPVLSVGLLRSGGHFGAIEYSNNAMTTNDGGLTYFNNYARSNSNSNWGTSFYHGEVGTPGGTAKARSAWAMLGRSFGLKLFGPYRHDKYNFLDAVSIQVDDDEFYAVNPNNPRDHWIVPANTDQVSLLFKK